MQVAANPEHPNKHHGTHTHTPPTTTTTSPSACACKVLKRPQEEKLEKLQPVGAKLFLI